jgi:dienelactone hydrolase
LSDDDGRLFAVTGTEPHTHFVPDTERWMTPWLDLALDRPEVDPDRLALLGISLGGYWVTRAAAHDDRIQALVANSPIVDLHHCQLGNLAYSAAVVFDWLDELSRETDGSAQGSTPGGVRAPDG